MTKIGLLQPKDSEPKALLEKGSKNELEQMESGIERMPKSGEIGKFNFLLIWISPFPIYIFLFILFTFDQCFQLFDPVHVTFLLGFICSFEVLSVLLFCPPKNAGNLDVQIIESEKPDHKIMTLSRQQYIHAFVTLVTAWLFVDGGIAYACMVVAPDNYIPAAAVGLLTACFVSMKIYISVRDKTWLNGFATQSISWSIFLQAYASFTIVAAFIFRGGYPTLLVGSFTYLGAVAHLRFLYNFENPPKTRCMLTIKHTRKFLAEWWQWICLMNGVIWAGLFLLILLPPSPPYSVPRSQCVQYTTLILIIFCSGISIIFVLTMVASCLASCFRRSRTM